MHGQSREAHLGIPLLGEAVFLGTTLHSTKAWLNVEAGLVEASQKQFGFCSTFGDLY